MSRKYSSLVLLVVLALVLITACSSSNGEGAETAVAEAKEPRVEPFVASGEPEIRDLQPTTEVVSNCNGVSEPVVKHPSISTETRHSVEWEIGGTAGVGLQIGSDLAPAKVNLEAALEGSVARDLSNSIQQGNAWDLPAEPGYIMEYTIMWREIWQPGYIDVTFLDPEPDIIRIDVDIRTGVQSEIIGQKATLCAPDAGSTVVSGAEPAEDEVSSTQPTFTAEPPTVTTLPSTMTPEGMGFRPIQVCPFFHKGTLYLDVVSNGGSCIASIPLMVDDQHKTAYPITDLSHDLYKIKPIVGYENGSGTACNYFIDVAIPPSHSIMLTMVDYTGEDVCGSMDGLRYAGNGEWLLTETGSEGIAPPVVDTITRAEVETWFRGTTDWDTVNDIIYNQIHTHPGKISFNEGDIIPKGALITADLGIEWTRYRPNIRLVANEGGGWGVFETLSEIHIQHANDLNHPVGGEYWMIDE